MLINGTRLVVTALCRAPAVPPATGKVSAVLLSYSMSGALGGGYSLTASRELATASTIYAMDADGAGKAVIVGSTTGGVVYAEPIEWASSRTEAGSSNEQAVAALNPLGNLNAVHKYRGLKPTRLSDTRPTEGNGAVAVAKAKIGGVAILTVQVAGKLGVPANGAGAVSLNVTVVDPEASGYLTVYPCGTRPTASNLNFTAGQPVANAVVAPLPANGEMLLLQRTRPRVGRRQRLVPSRSRLHRSVTGVRVRNSSQFAKGRRRRRPAPVRGCRRTEGQGRRRQRRTPGQRRCRVTQCDRRRSGRIRVRDRLPVRDATERVEPELHCAPDRAERGHRTGVGERPRSACSPASTPTSSPMPTAGSRRAPASTPSPRSASPTPGRAKTKGLSR